MGLLLNVYWLCLGVGGLYILIAGALGAIGAAGHAGGDVDASGGDFDAGSLDVSGGHDIGALPSGDLSGGLDAGGGFDAGGGLDVGGDLGGDFGGEVGGDVGADMGGDAGAGHDLAHAGHDHGHIIAGHTPTGDNTDAMAQTSPLNLLNMMAFLASFGGTGVALVASGFPHLLSFPLALVGGVGVASIFHFGVSRGLYRMQGGQAASNYDMLGLEAEVLTPIEEGHLGEVAYVLGGTRFTAPARLVQPGRATRADRVRVVDVQGNTLHVEIVRGLLD